MKDILFYLLFAIILYLVLSRVFENFNIDQENFDSSLVPVSSIITLAKVAQNLVNNRGLLTNPGSLQLGIDSVTRMTPSGTVVTPPILGNLNVTGTVDIKGSGSNVQYPALKVSGITSISGNTNITGDVTITGDTTMKDLLSNTASNTPSKTSIDKNLIIKNNTTIGGTVDIKGTTTINGSVDISGNTTINNFTVNQTNTSSQTRPNVKIDNNGNLDVLGKIQVNSYPLIPKGLIVSYSSTNVPLGWALCDGTNGTPDLRGRFIRMKSDPDVYNKGGTTNVWPKVQLVGNTPSTTIDNIDLKSSISSNTLPKTRQSIILNHNVGDTAGSDLIQLDRITLPIHNHNLVNDAHDHESSTRVVVADAAAWKGKWSVASRVMAGGSRYDISAAAPRAWLTSIVKSNITIEPTGGNGLVGNMPPYYTLVYIMKL